MNMQNILFSVALAGFVSVGTLAYGNEKATVRKDSISSDRYVTVAYGERSEDMMTGAISVLESDRIESSPEIGLDRILKGRLSGLAVISSGDEPGYASSDFYIRGTGTYGGGRQPLVLIDGIEGSIGQLNPGEVESVSVLKDASALALYGIRGANGVILIKTKRGQEGKTTVSIKAQTAFLTPTVMPEYLNSKDYLYYRNVAMANDGLVIPSDPRLNPDMYGVGNDPYLYPNTDWYGEMLKDYAMQQNYSAAISGGSSKVKYYVYAGGVYQNGLYSNTDKLSYTAINLRSNLDMNIFENFTVNMDLSTRIEQRATPLSSASDIFTALSTFPTYFPLTNRNGTLAGSAEYSNNPMGLITKTGYGNQNSRYLLGNVRANYDLVKFVPGLSVYAQYSFNTYKHYGRQKSQSFALYRENLDGTYSAYGQDTDLSLSYQQMNDDYALFMLFMGGAEYHKKWGRHQLDGSLNVLLSSKEYTGNNPNNKQLNYFGHIAYGYDRRYVVELAASYSGSEDFIGDNRFGFFPSLSAAWNISNESFLREVNFLDKLKLRASYGILGNSNIGLDRFPSDPTYYKGGGYYFGGSTTESDGAYEGMISNPDITFETSYNANVGIDFALWGNTLYGSLDLFNQKRVDIITQRTATKPAIIGQVLPYENYGEVTNRGAEVVLGYKNRVKDFNYYIEANLSFARSRVDVYDEVAGLSSWESRIGKPVTQLWGLQAQGLFQSQDEIDGWAQSVYSITKPGDVKYVDKNGDGFIDDADEIPMGNPTVPELVGGVLLGMEYKGIDFSILFTGVANRSVYVSNNVMWPGLNMTSIVEDCWQTGVNESSAKYPRLTTLTNNHNYRENSLWIIDGNYLRIQNVELGYTLPRKITRKIYIDQLRVFANASNLFSFDKLKKFGLNAENPDIGVTAYPQMAVYNVGLSVSF